MSKRQKGNQKENFNTWAKEFRELISNKQALRPSLEHFLNNTIDEITLGIIFDLHRGFKTNAYDLEVDHSCDEIYIDLESFLTHKLKKTQNCVCPSCERAVAATRFAPHLASCMGMGGRTSRSCHASRRVANNSKDRENSAYGGIGSDDDEDDVDWGTGDKRKKKRDKNGSRKNRGNSKRVIESEPIEQLNVDVEGEEDDLTNFRDILHLQDHSNSASPADSASSSGSVKKRDKSKSKKSGKRDRSPNLSME